MEHCNVIGGHLIGCSIRGSKHEAVDVPCRDSWHGELLDSGHFAIAVGDGVGSSNLSHEGSDLATREAVASLNERFQQETPLGREVAKDAVKDAVVDAREVLLAEANARNNPPSEFDTTLQVAIGGPTGVAGAVVGDGGIVCARDESYKPLVPREKEVVDLEYPSVTVPVQHTDWEASYRFGYEDNCHGFALFSDGLEQFIWDDDDSIETHVFDSIFELIQASTDEMSTAEELAATLRADPYIHSGDDKTLVVGDFSSGI